MAQKRGLRALKPSEAQIERAILDYLHYDRKLFAWKNSTAGYFDGKRKSFRAHASPYAINGVADVLCCMMGLFLCFEIKSEKGKQSVAQMHFESRVRDSGGFYFVVRSVRDVEEALDGVLALIHDE